MSGIGRICQMLTPIHKYGREAICVRGIHGIPVGGRNVVVGDGRERFVYVDRSAGFSITDERFREHFVYLDELRGSRISGLSE